MPDAGHALLFLLSDSFIRIIVLHCCCVGMCLSRMTMLEAARTSKTPLGGPNTYQGPLSSGHIFYQRKGTSTVRLKLHPGAEIASRAASIKFQLHFGRWPLTVISSSAMLDNYHL